MLIRVSRPVSVVILALVVLTMAGCGGPHGTGSETSGHVTTRPALHAGDALSLDRLYGLDEKAPVTAALRVRFRIDDGWHRAKTSSNDYHIYDKAQPECSVALPHLATPAQSAVHARTDRAASDEALRELSNNRLARGAKQHDRALKDAVVAAGDGGLALAAQLTKVRSKSDGLFPGITGDGPHYITISDVYFVRALEASRQVLALDVSCYHQKDTVRAAAEALDHIELVVAHPVRHHSLDSSLGNRGYASFDYELPGPAWVPVHSHSSAYRTYQSRHCQLELVNNQPGRRARALLHSGTDREATMVEAQRLRAGIASGARKTTQVDAGAVRVGDGVGIDVDMWSMTQDLLLSDGTRYYDFSVIRALSGPKPSVVAAVLGCDSRAAREDQRNLVLSNMHLSLGPA